MIKKLISLPDCKIYHPLLAIDKMYEIRGTVGNCFLINVWKVGKTLEDGLVPLLILSSRFE